MAAMDARGWLEQLVAFDTTSAKSNLPLIAYLQEFLGKHGVKSELVYNDERTKANLWATIGPERDGGVVLSGHTDVVPVTGQEWDTDPFRLTPVGDRLVGRGTSDMKGFLAVALSLVPEFAAANLKRPIHLAFSYDEEVGCIGVRRLIPQMLERKLRPTAVIVGEPTSMQVVTSHKSIRTFRTVVTGVEAHASRTEIGVNAIMHGAKLIAFLRKEAETQKEAGAGATNGYLPPYPTINVGVIEGGTALNIVPKTLSFLWEVRALPGMDEDEIPRRFRAFCDQEMLPRMRAESPKANIVTTPAHNVPALTDDPNSPALTLALALAGSNQAHKVSYGSEAGLFKQAGFATVLCGPGDIADAHRPNEAVSIAQLDACVRFQRGLLQHLQ